MSVPSAKPELLAPAGDWVCFQAALQAGADAVYLGLRSFNMRARAGANFSCDDLPELAARARAQQVKIYLTLNTIIFECECAEVERTLLQAKEFVDAVIVSDWGVVSLCKKHHIPFHISTQMSCSNALAAQWMKAQGASRIVFARECTLDEIKHIIQSVPIETEAFVHGAQCVAHSGRCFLSHEAYGCSANRGECHQPCRRRFLIKAIDRYTDATGKPLHDADAEFEVTPHTVLSAKDLCSLPFLDQLVDAGITSFKIEGRARKAEYVHAVVRAYRTAIDAIFSGTWSKELAAQLVAQTECVFHRESTCGLFFGRPGANQWTDKEDSQASLKKCFVGRVLNYYQKAHIAQVEICDAPLHVGDHIQIQGSTTGVVTCTVASLQHDETALTQTTAQHTWVTLPTPRVRVGDQVFVMRPRVPQKA